MKEPAIVSHWPTATNAPVAPFMLVRFTVFNKRGVGRIIELHANPIAFPDATEMEPVDPLVLVKDPPKSNAVELNAKLSPVPVSLRGFTGKLQFRPFDENATDPEDQRPVATQAYPV